MRFTRMRHLLTFLCLFWSLLAYSQTDSNKRWESIRSPLVAFGVAYGDIVGVINYSQGYFPNKKDAQSKTPCFTFDFRFLSRLKKVALGIAYSYQKATFNLHDSETPNSFYFDENYERLNFAVKPHFFIFATRRVEMFFGPRIGLTMWRITNDHPTQPVDKVIYAPSIQVYSGFRYFFGRLGIGIEGGLGTAPYIWQANLAYRFKKNF